VRSALSAFKAGLRHIKKCLNHNAIFYSLWLI
jgi:hypothetical protein